MRGADANVPSTSLPRAALIGPLPPRFGGATPGGVATHQLHLAEGLARAGVCAPLLATNVDSAVRDKPAFPALAMRRPRRSGEWLEPGYLRQVRPFRLMRYAAALAGGRNASLGSRKAVLADTAWYAHFLRIVRPDVVHVQHPLERCDYVRFVLRQERLAVPLVVTAHSLFDEHAEHTIRQHMAPNLRAADRVIAVSPHVADQVASLSVEQDRIRVIRSGVDTQEFAPKDRIACRAELGLDLDLPLVLFVGNLEPRKAVDRLIQAMAQITSRLPNAQLIVIGSGESAGADNQEPYLRRLVDDLRLGGSVRLLGRVSDAELLRWYGAADVFALPSSSEAQGLVALEAMSMGLPVVASAVGGLLGTIQDRESGYLVPFGDVRQLAERIIRLLADPGLAASMSQAARRRVLSDFNWDTAVQATIEVYREVAACR